MRLRHQVLKIVWTSFRIDLLSFESKTNRGWWWWMFLLPLMNFERFRFVTLFIGLTVTHLLVITNSLTELEPHKQTKCTEVETQITDWLTLAEVTSFSDYMITFLKKKNIRNAENGFCNDKMFGWTGPNLKLFKLSGSSIFPTAR